ncbi:hypothetical protein LTR17_020167 [Elasticomyces elasticus]|nr:hypothetical protein LTR17_020167 [Elasticomyces elasticus]
MCRQRQMHEYEDENGNKEGVSHVLGHDTGYGKTMHPLAVYIINILIDEMEKDLMEAPHRHCTKGVEVCPGVFHYVPGPHLHVMPDGLVNHFLDEWEITVDLDVLGKPTGVRPVLMMAYELKGGRPADMEVVTADSMDFKALLHPDNN